MKLNDFILKTKAPTPTPLMDAIICWKLLWNSWNRNFPLKPFLELAGNFM